MTHKAVVYLAAGAVWMTCLHAALLGFGVYDGKLINEPIAWYFLAKGVFCSLSLLLARALLEELRGLRRDWNRDPGPGE